MKKWNALDEDSNRKDNVRNKRHESLEDQGGMGHCHGEMDTFYKTRYTAQGDGGEM